MSQKVKVLYVGRSVDMDEQEAAKTITIEVPQNETYLDNISFSTSVYPAQAMLTSIDMAGNTGLTDGELPLSYFHEAVRPEGLRIKKTFVQGDKIKIDLQDSTVGEFAPYVVHAVFTFLQSS